MRLPLSLHEHAVLDADGVHLFDVLVEGDTSALGRAREVVALVDAASALADALREVAEGPAAHTMTEKSRGAALRALNLVDRARADT